MRASEIRRMRQNLHRGSISPGRSTKVSALRLLTHGALMYSIRTESTLVPLSCCEGPLGGGVPSQARGDVPNSNHVQNGTNRLAGQRFPTGNLRKARSGSVLPQVRLDVDIMDMSYTHEDIRQAHRYSRLLAQCDRLFPHTIYTEVRNVCHS